MNTVVRRGSFVNYSAIKPKLQLVEQLISKYTVSRVLPFATVHRIPDSQTILFRLQPDILFDSLINNIFFYKLLASLRFHFVKLILFWNCIGIWDFIKFTKLIGALLDLSSTSKFIYRRPTVGHRRRMTVVNTQFQRGPSAIFLKVVLLYRKGRGKF